MILLSAYAVPGIKVKKPLPGSVNIKNRITQLVADEFGVEFKDVFRKSRKRELVLTRQVSMIFIRRFDSLSKLVSIGDFFGGKDHTTVIHSLKTIQNLMETDKVLRDRVNKIEGLI